MDARRLLRLLAAALAAVLLAMFASAGDAPARSSERPRNISSPTITGVADEGQTLTGHNGSWACNPACAPAGPENRGGYEFQWQRCDAAGANCGNIEGADEQNYVVAPEDRGSTLRVVVTATNYDCNVLITECRYSSDSANSAVTAVVPGQPPGEPPPPAPDEGPPVSKVLPVVAGLPQEGQTLSGSTGDWVGTEPMGYTYQWSRCAASSAGGTCAAIAGATGSAYAVDPADIGSTLSVTVTATNPEGSASATSPPTLVVVAVPIVVPVAMSPPGVFGMPKEGATLTATAGSWSGSPPPAFSFNWLRCGRYGESCLPILGAAGPVYVATAADGGRTLQVVVTATSRAGSATATSPPTPMIAPKGLLHLLDGRESVPASSVISPDRLRIDRVKFAPRSGRTIRGSFHVSDTRGFVVRGALVSVRGAQISGGGPVTTGADGSVSVTFRVSVAKRARGGKLVLLVQAFKPGEGPSGSASVRTRVTLRLKPAR